jgi:multimeric flavodoxin WrbA
MKVLVIMGSPRKGNTYHAAERIREIMQEKARVDWEYVMLRDLNLEQCRGCANCIVKGEEFCPVNDDVSGLTRRMHDADGVIFASPVYSLQVTGLMKVFIDRHSYILHRPRFFGKKALILATAGAVGISEVLKYLDAVVHMWGFEVVGKAGIFEEFIPGTRQLENDQRLREAAEEFHASLQRKSPPRPGFMDIIVFHGLRATFDELGEVFPADRTYWGEKGWMEKDARYFVDVPVNPLYNAVGVLLEKFQRRQIRKDLREMNHRVSV